MAKVRNVSSFDLEVHGLGVIERDAVAEVPADAVYGLTCSTNWEPADRKAQDAHDTAETAARG